jgi:hypothetical protein
MNLHQIQLNYQPSEDRILMRLSFRDDAPALKEIRAWLTRRLVGNLWAGIIQALETQIRLDKPQAAHASAEIVSLEHQASVIAIRARGEFNLPFDDAEQAYPAGTAPLLLTLAQFTMAAGQPLRINFSPGGEGDGFEVGFTQSLLHGFCTLLQDVVKATDWGIDLRLPAATASETAPRVLN